MTELIRRLVGICLFQNGPQELPASWNLLAAAVAADIVISYPLALGVSPSDYPGLQVLLAMILGIAFIRAALAARGLPGRFLQTATAFFGTDALLTLLALPIAVTLPPEPDPQIGMARFGLLLAQLWSIAIMGHILRHALSVALGVGVLVAFGYTVGAILISQALLG